MTSPDPPPSRGRVYGLWGLQVVRYMFRNMCYMYVNIRNCALSRIASKIGPLGVIFIIVIFVLKKSTVTHESSSLTERDKNIRKLVNLQTGYWSVRAPLSPSRLNLSLPLIGIINNKVIYAHGSSLEPIELFLPYVNMLRHILKDWKKRKMTFSGSWAANIDRGDVSTSQDYSDTVLSLVGSRPKHTRGVLWPNRFDALEFSSPGCGKDHDYDRKKFSNIPWEEREDTPFWRGSLTNGMDLELSRFEAYNDSTYVYHPFDFNPRPFLVRFSRLHPLLLDAAWTHIDAFEDEHRKAIETHYGERAEFIPREIYLTRYKYLFVIHGFGTAYRLRDHLASGLCSILHEGKFTEWYYPLLKPWVHYVPLREDMSNLESVLEWLKTHPDKGRQIGRNARKFYLDYLTFENISNYVYHLGSRLALVEKYIDLDGILQNSGTNFREFAEKDCGAGRTHDRIPAAVEFVEVRNRSKTNRSRVEYVRVVNF
ncbi:hypothetical protein AAMO2058_000357400 [Amorphochlora amoebiformis]